MPINFNSNNSVMEYLLWNPSVFASAKSQHPNKVTPHIERFSEGITDLHSMLEKSNQVRLDVPLGFEEDRGLHDMFESNLQEIDKGLRDYDSLEGKFIAK